MLQEHPTCPFEELAIISGTAEGWWSLGPVSSDAVVRATSKKARRLGGHALLGVTFEPHGVTATVIRFTQDDCQR